MRIPEPSRILRAISSKPWAIDPAKAQEIVALLELRAQGRARSDDEIATAIEARNGTALPESGNGVAVIPVHGVLAHRMSAIEESSGGASVERIMGQFDAAVADGNIRTIVLHVDSPGGSCEGIVEASQKIFQARSEKRIVAIADTLMASAAYFIASSAQEVLVTPSGMVGSIGTLAIHTEFSRMDAELGITTTVFTSGRFKGEGNPHEPLTDDAQAHIQEAVDDFYDQFVETVARNRGVSGDQVRNGMGQGRALTARRSLEAGLVDRVASFEELLTELGIEKAPRRTGARADVTSNRSPTMASIAAGENLARVLNDRIDEMATEDRTRSQIIDEMADAAGIEPGTVNQILDGSINCPPIDRLEGFAEVLDLSVDTLTDAGEADGCDYSADEDDEGGTEASASSCPNCAPTRARSDSHRPAPSGQEGQMEKTIAPQGGADKHQIHQERERVNAIIDLCELHGDLVTSEDRAKWIEGNTTPAQATKEIVRRKREALEPSSAPAPDQALRPADRTRVESVRDRAADQPGIRMARFIRAYAAGGGDRRESIRWAQEHGYPEIAAAMTSGSFGSGGAMVPENYLADEFIELLRPRSAVRSLDPTMWPMVGGQATVPKLTGGATASYKGEAQKGTKSEATTGRVNLVAKQLIALVPLSTQLIRRSSPAADTVVRDDTIAAVGQRSDLAFIRGDGTAHTPKGLLNQALAANKFNANATVNLANVTTDLGKAMLKLEEADVRMIRPGWIFAPRTKQYLFDVRDGNGNFAFRDEMRDGTLNGHPFAVTSQIPTNLGGGGDESEIYFADFADVVIGDEEQLRVDVSSEATYHDGATVVSTFENDEVLLRVISEHDLGLRHDESVTVIQAVTWGA